ncbi:glycosyltransferase family 1 protein [Candidatus Woesearchaeota archaeon]|nr:MAG: glycosyltransferase family 1 protein [Candidatus Woesearchaeota archaeon]
MRKLLIATDNFLPRWDGIARFLSEVIPRIKNQYEITVLAPDFGETTDEGYKVIKFPVNKKIKLGDFHPAKIKYGIIKEAVRNADIVFTQTIGPIGGLAIKAAAKYKKPTAAFIHSIELELLPMALKGQFRRFAYPLVKRISSYLYKKCKILIIPSEHVEELLHWQQIHAKTAIVHLGTDTKKFIPAKDKAKAKELLNLDKTKIIIGYHGRIAREKDLSTLLRAFLRLQRSHANLQLLLVGDGVKDILEKFDRPGVILVPAQQNVVPYLQAMDIYALTSLTETTSLSTLEAMSCGLPVIATKVGFINDYIVNQYNGFLIDKKNPYQLAKIIEALARNPEARKKIGDRARQTVADKFNWDTTANEIEKVLEKL